ncbi:MULTISPECIES: DUF3108 domain-containing protein [unclassified Nonomuraea]|uniref:hypothetical protein n=1 Tax=Nonomuraea sp. NPDC003804 TaxID=3154547 RepID=UPI0033AB112A
MDIPELADLIWLFEGDPEPQHDDVGWPIGLHAFHLVRGATAVLFSLDPLAGEAYVSLYADGQEIATVSRLRPLGRLSVESDGPRYEGLTLWFRDENRAPVRLQTKPVIRMTW